MTAHEAPTEGSSTMRDRIALLAQQLGLKDRLNDRVETLSGGLARRAEIAKALMPEPKLLLLDEPSSGLDPGARRDLRDLLLQIRKERNTTILWTTHLMDEAEVCDRVGILHQGKLVAEGTPKNLKEEVATEVVMVTVEHPSAHHLLAKMYEVFPDEIQAAEIRKGSLEDVFLKRTGHRFGGDA